MSASLLLLVSCHYLDMYRYEREHDNSLAVFFFANYVGPCFSTACQFEHTPHFLNASYAAWFPGILFLQN